jgi:hypothetical protein
MIDIFEEPKVYSVDVEVKALIPLRGNKKEAMTIKLYSEPLTLIGKEIASTEIKKRFLHKVYKRKINRSEYDRIEFIIVSLKVNKFLTNLCYKFDFDTT